MTAALIAAFEELDEANDKRIGGTDDSVTDVLCALETRLLNMRSDVPELLAWKVRRLTRAIENDWRDVEVRVIACSIIRDVELFNA